MSALEKTIAMISPEWAAKRAYFRAVLDVDQSRAYTAAKGGRRGEGWISGDRSANGEIGPVLKKIRDRARDLVRNNPYAAGYPGLMATKVIGTGIQPRLAMTGDENKAARQRARDIWSRFADNCDPEGATDYYGLQSLAERARAESGEVLIRTIRLPTKAKAAFPLQIAVQEGDYIDTGKSQELDNGNIVIQGVEFDQYGRRVAYWLFDEHPGESVISFARRSPASTRVDAADVDHVFERLRPGQVRGVSPFAAVAMKIRDVDDLDDAELMRRKIAACFVAFRRPATGPAASSLTGKPRDDGAGRKVETMAPGMIKDMGPGEEVTFGDPPTVDNVTDYYFGQLYAVAAGLGVTFEQLTGNLKGVNLSSIRVGENRFRDLRDHLQWHVWITGPCRRQWNRVGQVARVTGDLAIKDPWTPRWIPPAWRSPDPATDVEVAKDAVRSLQMSPFDAIANSGFDPEEVLDETQQFNSMVDSRGIITDMDPRKVSLASTTRPASSNESTAGSKSAA